MNTKLKFSADTRRKALQWGFTMASFDDATIDRLSRLPREEVVYMTFAICDDDTGNQYLQGFVKTVRCLHVCRLTRLIGPVCFSILTHSNISNILAEIRLNSYSEFGDTWVLDNWVLHRRGGALDMFKRYNR